MRAPATLKWTFPSDKRRLLAADLAAGELKGKDLTLLAVVTAIAQRQGLVTLTARVNINMWIHINE